MEYQEPLLEYQEALWNTKNLYRNTTKKLDGIPRRNLMEYPEAGMQRSFMEYKLWNTRKFYAIPRIFTGVPRNFIEYEETLWNIKKLYEIQRNLYRVARSVSEQYKETR